MVEMYGSLGQTRLSSDELTTTRKRLLERSEDEATKITRKEEDRKSRVHAGKYHLIINFLDPNQSNFGLSKQAADALEADSIDFMALSGALRFKQAVLAIRA